ncbi:hypothetical protein F5Y04DRAFT_121039 [Hypomontagnella monticulosa]|nr:hypothetical protein F5Y04DRAFT_121039 [Hypomontagnella monticulosa]
MLEGNELKDSKSERVDTSDFITARRERGKLAQRAFRQRQIDTIRTLEQENRRLRKAISAISDAADKDDAALSRAISDARKVAGLPATEDKALPPAHTVTVTDPDDSGWSNGPSIDDTANTVPVPNHNEDTFKATIPYVAAQDPESDWSLSFPGDSSGAYTSVSNPEAFDSGIDMSMPTSENTDGIMVPTGPSPAWLELDRPIHISNPPPDIMPYMGAGAYTLAGQIYWAAMAFGFHTLRTIVSTPTPPPAAVEHAMDVFAFTLKKVALPQVMGLIHARLIFRRYGYFQAGNRGNMEEMKGYLNPVVPVEISTALIEEFQNAGIRRDDYLTPLDIERQLRDRFRDEYPVFEAALRGQAIAQEHVHCMRQLMQIMSRQSMCFGDGPRWRPESVDTLVNGWKMSTRAFAVY